MTNKSPLVVLTGPTAVGKTELSIKLAKAINGEIISADSVQVYRHMNIGSAKITEEEMHGVTHHLIDILNPDEEFNVALFKKYADIAIADIYGRGHIPIIVGGTGFYIQAVLNNIDFTETSDDGYRATLEELYKNHGAKYLHDILKKEDPDSADNIHPNNVKRVIRALEYKHQTGKLISVHNEEERIKESFYNSAYFVLNCDRKLLYERIDKRVDIMINEGLVDEVNSLISTFNLNKSMTSMQALGYKEIYDYLVNDITLDEAIYLLKRDTRHFAKRQLTWFNREKEVLMIDKDILNTEDKQLDYILKILSEREII